LQIVLLFIVKQCLFSARKKATNKSLQKNYLRVELILFIDLHESFLDTSKGEMNFFRSKSKKSADDAKPAEPEVEYVRTENPLLKPKKKEPATVETATDSLTEANDTLSTTDQFIETDGKETEILLTESLLTDNSQTSAAMTEESQAIPTEVVPIVDNKPKRQ